MCPRAFQQQSPDWNTSEHTAGHRYERVRVRTSAGCIDGSNQDSFDFVQGDLIGNAIVQIGGPGRGVAGHVLGPLERAAISHVLRNPGGTKRVATDFRRQSGVPRSALDHTQRVVSMHAVAG